MAISPLTPQTSASTPIETKSQPGEQLTSLEVQKRSLNVSILKSTEATLSVKDQPLALVLRAAIEKINEQLAPTLGENAIQTAAASGIDYSPEATAERIASLSTAFFSAFKDQHPNDNQTNALNKFLDIISGGIDKGFKEARDILDGLQVLNGDIASNIDKTYELVQQGLQAFKEKLSVSDSAPANSAPAD